MDFLKFDGQNPEWHNKENTGQQDIRDSLPQRGGKYAKTGD